jgi:hypothetical protein
MVAVTWDPVNLGAYIVLTNSNLTASNNRGGNWTIARGQNGKTTGKWYWEIFLDFTSSNPITGVVINTSNLGGAFDSVWPGGFDTGAGMSQSVSYVTTWTKVNTATLTLATNDVLMFALDMGAGKLWIGKNGTWLSAANPATGAGEWVSGVTGTVYPAASLLNTIDFATIRSQASDFSFTPPSGFTPYAGSIAQNLTVGLYQNLPDGFFTEVLVSSITLSQTAKFNNPAGPNFGHVISTTVGLTAQRFQSSQTFQTHVLSAGPVQLSATAPLVNASTINYAHTLTVGSVTLTPQKLTNNQQFYPINLGQGQLLDVQRFAPNNTFYTQTITVGGITIAVGPSFANSSSFYAHVLTAQQVLGVSQYVDADTFYLIGLSIGLTAATFTNISTFATHSLGVSATTLSPVANLANSNGFYGQSLTTSLVMLASNYVDGDGFFTHVISLALEPTDLVNDSQFYVATVSRLSNAQIISPNTFLSSATFESPVFLFSAVDVRAFPFNSTNQFYGHVVSLSKFTQTLSAQTFISTSSFPVHSLLTGKRFAAPRRASSAREARPSYNDARNNSARAARRN